MLLEVSTMPFQNKSEQDIKPLSKNELKMINDLVGLPRGAKALTEAQIRQMFDLRKNGIFLSFVSTDSEEKMEKAIWLPPLTASLVINSMKIRGDEVPYDTHVIIRHFDAYDQSIKNIFGGKSRAENKFGVKFIDGKEFDALLSSIKNRLWLKNRSSIIDALEPLLVSDTPFFEATKSLKSNPEMAWVKMCNERIRKLSIGNQAHREIWDIAQKNGADKGIPYLSCESILNTKIDERIKIFTDSPIKNDFVSATPFHGNDLEDIAERAFFEAEEHLTDLRHANIHSKANYLCSGKTFRFGKQMTQVMLNTDAMKVPGSLFSSLPAPGIGILLEMPDNDAIEFSSLPAEYGHSGNVIFATLGHTIEPSGDHRLSLSWFSEAPRRFDDAVSITFSDNDENIPSLLLKRQVEAGKTTLGMTLLPDALSVLADPVGNSEKIPEFMNGDPVRFAKSVFGEDEEPGDFASLFAYAKGKNIEKHSNDSLKVLNGIISAAYYICCENAEMNEIGKTGVLEIKSCGDSIEQAAEMNDSLNHSGTKKPYMYTSHYRGYWTKVGDGDKVKGPLKPAKNGGLLEKRPVFIHGGWACLPKNHEDRKLDNSIRKTLGFSA